LFKIGAGENPNPAVEAHPKAPLELKGDPADTDTDA
jgi:hypothetical protein